MKEVDFKRAGLSSMVMGFLCFVSFTVAIAQENPAVRQSRQLIDNDQPTKAINLLNEAIKANPLDASLLYYLGRAQVVTGKDPKAAEINFQKCVELNPKDGLGLAGKGHLRMVENNVAEAKSLFEQALALSKSKNAAVLRAVGEGYLTNDKFSNEALTTLLKAKSTGDTDPYTYILLGDAYTKLTKGGDAVTAYEKAASLDPKSGIPYYKIGLVYFRSKNETVAEESLLKAVSVDPNTALAHKELGELYYGKKEAAKAVKSYESYLAITENPEPAKLRYAFFLFMAKEYVKANKVFKELAQKPEVSCTTLKYYAFSLVESGEGEASRPVFVQYFAKCEKELQAADYNYEGKMLQKLATDKKDPAMDSLAVISYKKSLALEPNQPEIAQNVAETLFKLKRYKETVEAYRALRSVKPKLSSQDLFTMGRACYVDSLLVEADTAFSKLIEAQPNMTVGYLWLARTKARLDPESEQGLAKPYFEKLIEKASANPEKGKNDLIEAYLYLGYYHFIIKTEVATGKSYYEKAKALNPDADKKAIIDQALKAIDDYVKAQQAQQKPKKDK